MLKHLREIQYHDRYGEKSSIVIPDGMVVNCGDKVQDNRLCYVVVTVVEVGHTPEYNTTIYIAKDV